MQGSLKNPQLRDVRARESEGKWLQKSARELEGEKAFWVDCLMTDLELKL